MNRALLIGINEYPVKPLNGCVNDVTGMTNLLVERCHFQKSEIRLLVNDRATKLAIIDRLKWLVTGLRENDRVLLFFSGHGVQLPTRNPQGEVDGLDEVICPVDFNWTEETSVRDKELASIFAGVPPGVLFTFIADSCHSGDLTKDFRTMSPKIIEKYIQPPIDIAWRIQVAKEKNIKPLGLKSVSPGKVLLISGCESHQTSADDFIDNQYNGALTYHLIKHLSNGGMQEPMEQAVQNIIKMMKPKYPQNPQISGSNELKKRQFLK